MSEEQDYAHGLDAPFVGVLLVFFAIFCGVAYALVRQVVG